ncbi:MAG: penicillin acylase family protein [Alphaproteobacteria bacterium]|nr:penicillin acylase family protein [Alphaproteobacteria bacterium]
MRLSPRARCIGLGLLLLLALTIVGSVWIFNRALPDYAGNKAMPGLSAQVSVMRDSYGVPHIFATNTYDAFRTLGYVHASERMFQMEMQRHAGQGRLAEITGKDTLGIDKFTRTLGLYRLAESSYAALSPEAQSLLQAYAGGVNTWLETHRYAMPPELFLLRVKPEPWKPADSIVWGKLMGLQLSKNYKLEALRAKLAPKLSMAEMNALFPLPSGSAPVTTGPRSKLPIAEPPVKKSHDKKHRKISDALDQLGQITSLTHAASNEWVISGARTESGKPILANDPHLGLEAPILWYLARIVTPEGSIKGATVPGLPAILLGQNDHIAWGFTTTGSDVQDLFIETLDPKNPEQYLTPSGSESFAQRTETIRVKGAGNVTLQVRSTRHGPVLSDIDDDLAALAGEGKVMALAFTGLGAADTTSDALMRLNFSKNWKDFLSALQLYQTPPQNIVYADTEGNIGFANPGLVPVRKEGRGLTPVDGTSGTYDWKGTVPFAYLPQLYNPQSGFVFNANNAVASSAGFYFLGMDWEEPYRAERLQEFFDTVEKHNLDGSAAMQNDHVSSAARDLLPHLLRLQFSYPHHDDNPRAAEAVAMLRGWDGTMDKNRPEPLIFEGWMQALHRFLLVEKTGMELEAKGPFNAAGMSFILTNGAKDWCPEADCDRVTLQALDEALDMLTQRHGLDMNKWRWGNEHVTLLKHKFFSHIPGMKRLSGFFAPSSGDFYTLDRGGSFEASERYPFARTHGGGFRGIYDLADPTQSRFMIATGESGHVTSPHYGDLFGLWSEGKYITLSGTRDELAAQGSWELVFNPAD